MNNFISSITINQGLVTHLTLSAIAPADLPVSGVTPGGYTNPNIMVDQWGRVTFAVSNAAATGTVTTVSIVTANGVSGSVANPTTTPAITLTLGAITPTSVAASGTVTGSNLSGTNTGDQTITLTGHVTGSGPGSFATTIAAGVVTEAMQNLTDNTTGNVSASAHGYCPKTPNDVTKFLDGTGVFSVPTPLRGYIDGFVLANDAGTPNTVLDFGSGHATDSSGTFLLSRTAMTKDCSAAWVAGNTNGGNFVGAGLGVSTWYHCFAIRKTADGSVDFGIDTSVTAANIPAGYGNYRRIGSIKTDGSSHILAFHQYDDEFWWDTSVADVTAVNSGTAAVTRTLTVPTGVKVKAIFDLSIYDSGGATCEAYVAALDSVDQTPLFTADIQSTASSTAAIEGYGAQAIWTNTSAQIRSRQTSSTATNTIRIRTRGWMDPRGRNS